MITPTFPIYSIPIMSYLFRLLATSQCVTFNAQTASVSINPYPENDIDPTKQKSKEKKNVIEDLEDNKPKYKCISECCVIS